MAKWQRLPRVPKVAKPWIYDDVQSTPDVVRCYEKGQAGTFFDPDARDELLGSQDEPDGEVIATQFFAESGKGKLSLPFLPAQEHYNVWPKPGQETGDCVSRMIANTGLVLIGAEVAAAEPDPLTGYLESFPVVSEIARKNGVLCSETSYGDRGHRSAGASCYKLIHHVTKTAGLLVRKQYGEYDLEKLNTKLAIAWGGRGCPQELRDEGKQHQIRLAADVDNHEVGRDFIANGYPLGVCSGLGFSNQRDENGYSKRSGSWAHSWAIGGYDDRPSTIEIYGFPLALFIHDWHLWNKGPTLIRGTQIHIPRGCMWIDARLLDRSDVTALSNLAGWKPRNLPDYSPGFN